MSKTVPHPPLEMKRCSPAWAENSTRIARLATCLDEESSIGISRRRFVIDPSTDLMPSKGMVGAGGMGTRGLLAIMGYATNTNLIGLRSGWIRPHGRELQALKPADMSSFKPQVLDSSPQAVPYKAVTEGMAFPDAIETTSRPRWSSLFGFPMISHTGKLCCQLLGAESIGLNVGEGEDVLRPKHY